MTDRKATLKRKAPVAAAATSPSPRAPRVGGRRTQASEDTGAHLQPAGPAASPLSPPCPQPHRPPALAQKHQLPDTLPASSNLTARLPSRPNAAYLPHLNAPSLPPSSGKDPLLPTHSTGYFFLRMLVGERPYLRVYKPLVSVRL